MPAENDGLGDQYKKKVKERVDAEKAASDKTGGIPDHFPSKESSGPGSSANNESLEPGPLGYDQSKISRRMIQEALFANELGDGMLFAALNRGRFLYCTNKQEWFEWTGHYWKLDVLGSAQMAVDEVAAAYLAEYYRVSAEEAQARAANDKDKQSEKKKNATSLLERARQLRSVRRRTNCLEWAHTCPDPLGVTGEDFDLRPMLFACANGVIDLETGLLLPGNSDDLLTLASPVEFLGIDCPAPIWDRTLLEIFNGQEEIVSYLQRLLGYAMTGLIREKVFPVFYGPTGWNGRSLIIETVSHVMGALAGSIQSEMLLSQRYAKSSAAPSPDIIALKGMRMAFASEIDEGQKFSAAKIKWLTGKDELIGRSPHDKYSTRFYPTHKLFLMTNTQPEAPSNDKAFWERMHLIPFSISFVNRDPQEPYERRAILDLDQQLLREESGILAWLVRGCLLYQQRGIDPPIEITAATEEYRRGEDVLADFIDECCIREDGAKGKANELYQRYVKWYHDNIGEKERSGTWFGKQLRQKFQKTKSHGLVIYQGITLKDNQGEL
jgi:putative DNA primase/helicase